MAAFHLRKAHINDVKAIHALLLACAQQGQLLPRALIWLYSHIRNFNVLETEEGRIVACAALAPVWEDLAEVCSLVVDDSMRRQGLGRLVVQACLDECAALHIKKVFALTYQAEFFRRVGFVEVEKGVLPQKIWADCVHCPKYPDCDETAVYLELAE